MFMESPIASRRSRLFAFFAGEQLASYPSCIAQTGSRTELVPDI